MCARLSAVGCNVATAASKRSGVDPVDDWQSFDEALDAFRAAHPMLGLPTGEWAALNLRRNFGQQLVERGAAVKLPTRKWIAHRRRFGPVLFELLTSEPARIIEQAQARQAAEGGVR
jgi:hypothetical protein